MLTLHNYAAKNRLRRLTVVHIPRNSNSATTQNRGKATMPMPPYTRSHDNIGQSCHGSHNNFGGNGSIGASASKLNWGQPKDVKADRKKSFEVVQL